MSEVHGVWLVLGGHEEEHDPVYELHAAEGVDPHEHEDPVQHRHGDVLQDGGELHGQPRQDEHAHARHALLPHTHELRRLARRRGLAVNLRQ